MSSSNENNISKDPLLENKKTISEVISDSITINENGEAVINDPNLAKQTQELSLAELEEVAGGFGISEAAGAGCGCGC